MEIDNSAKALSSPVAGGAAKSADAKAVIVADRIQLPKIEAKAAPEKPEFKASDIDKAVADLQAYV